jgi:general secretion pathway protein A
MYESHFGITGPPFQLSPDPSFYFDSKGHHDALAVLRRGLAEPRGFVVVSGEIGAGKTTLVRTLIGELDPSRVAVGQVLSTQLEDLDLLRAILLAFGVPADAQERNVLHAALLAHLHGLAREGRRAVLIVDEAQNLHRSAFDMLVELESTGADGVPGRTLKICLVGQPELRDLVGSGDLLALRERIGASCHLGPLGVDEVGAYIRHRLGKVGWNGTPAFEAGVFEEIHRWTQGVPRRINLLCNRLMLSRFLTAQAQIDVDAVASTAQSLRAEIGDTSVPPPVVRRAAAASEAAAPPPQSEATAAAPAPELRGSAPAADAASADAASADAASADAATSDVAPPADALASPAVEPLADAAAAPAGGTPADIPAPQVPAPRAEGPRGPAVLGPLTVPHAEPFVAPLVAAPGSTPHAAIDVVLPPVPVEPAPRAPVPGAPAAPAAVSAAEAAAATEATEATEAAPARQPVPPLLTQVVPADASRPLVLVVGGQADHLAAAALLRALAARDDLPVALLVRAYANNAFDRNRDMYAGLDVAGRVIALGVAGGTYAGRAAELMQRFEFVVDQCQPAAVVVFDGSDAALSCGLVASRKSVPVVQIGAGLRAGTGSGAADITRKLTDQLSDVLYTSEADASTRLRQEGLPAERLYFAGSLTVDALQIALRSSFGRTGPRERLGIAPEFVADRNGYGVVALDAAANVGDRQTFTELVTIARDVSRDVPLVWPMHTRTREQLAKFRLDALIRGERIACMPTQGYVAFAPMLANATCVLTDSWHVQEETTALSIPCLTLGNEPERPLTTAIGSNVAVGRNKALVTRTVWECIFNGGKRGTVPELWDGQAGARIAEHLALWLRVAQERGPRRGVTVAG